MTREELKELIDEEIKENGQGEITGPVLNNVLQRMLETLPGQRNPETNSELFNSDFNTATGENSHAEGLGTRAVSDASHAEGKYNKGYSEAIHEVGIGTNNSTRRDTHVITVDGKHYILGLGGFNTGNEDLADCEDLAIVVNNRVTTEQMAQAVLVEKQRAEGAEAQLRTGLQNKMPNPEDLYSNPPLELGNTYGVYTYKGFPCHCRTIIHNGEYKLVICAEHGGTSGVSGQKYFVYGDHGGNITLESTYDSTNVPDWVKRGFGEATATASYPGLLSSDSYKKLRDLPTNAGLSDTIEGLTNDILAETNRAEDAEAELSARIDAIVQGRDVRDIVPNYQALLDYDTTTLGDNDIIMVLLDNTKSDHTTYYRWHATEQTWEFIGGLAFTYTKTEIDQKFADLHIVLPVFNEQSSQELLAQVDETIRHAGADAQFKIAIPVDDLQGNVTVTYVKTNPMHTYLGVFADDRSELYHITRTLITPRTYTCEVITKVFATADALAQLIKDLYNADPAEGEEKGDIVKINEALEGKQDADKMQSVITESDTNYPSSNAVASYVQGREVFEKGTGANSVVQKGGNNVASEIRAIAIGYRTTASGVNTFAQGFTTTASGGYSHAEGNQSTASGNNSHAEGNQSTASGGNSHSEGSHSRALGGNSHAEGNYTTAGDADALTGEPSTSVGYATHAEGQYTLARGCSAHAEGVKTNATGECSHAEGYSTNATGGRSHAEGSSTTASGRYSHAEGSSTTASGSYSHAEGYSTTAGGTYSHAEGYSTNATGECSHAEGSASDASGRYSHAEGYRTKARGNYSHAEGTYNIGYNDSIHEVGVGDDLQRKNAHTIKRDGKHYILGVGGYDGTQTDLSQVDDLAEVLRIMQNTTDEKIPIPNNLREVIGSELDNLYGVYMYKGYPCHCRTIIHNNEYKLVICAEHDGTSGISGQKYFVYGDQGGNITLENIYDSTNVLDWIKRGFGEATATASYPGLLSADYYKKLRDLPTNSVLQDKLNAITKLQDAIESDTLVIKAGTFDTNKAVYDLLTATPHLAKLVVYLNATTNTYYNLNTWKQDGEVFRFSYLREDGDNLVVTRFSLDSTGKVS